MKWALALLALAACQIESRSADLRCDLPADCTGGRTCVGGWCVLDGVDASTMDAPPGDGSTACPAECTECLGSTCVIRCNGAAECAEPVVCPAELDCLVQCGGVGSCMGGIDCSTATGCEITCTAESACAGAIACGTGPCEVACSGGSACAGGVACQDSCRCDVTCGGTACATPAQCPFGSNCDTGAGCRSGPGTCHSC